MSEGIMEINPLMPYEDIRADRLSVPAVGLGLAALAKGVSQNTLNRTTDTPSGKVFAPTGETIEPTKLPGMAPAEKLKGLPGLLGIELAKKLEGMSQASPTPKNKGFTTPASEDMKILHNVENEDDDTENTTTDNFITKEDKRSVTNNLKTQNFLDDKVMNKLLKMRGGSVEGFRELFKRAAPMPASTKAKMEMELQEILFDKYKINEYPEGESPETVHELRKKYLMDTYHKRMGAIEYISSVAYDVIGEKSNDSMLVVDDDGIPLAGAKIAIPGTKNYNRSDIYAKDALVIVEAGSVFRNAGDQLMKDIVQKAKDEGRRFVVAEDLTSEGALEAFKNRGFKTPTTKETKKFKGQKIRRPNGKSAVQKNLVLDLGAPEKKAYGGLIGKPLSGGSRYI
jgi:hypothetical protein